MTAKLTQQEYINRCNIRHSGKYDYSLLQYVGGNTKVVVICKKHGQFNVLASNHMRKSGCPLCANETRNDGVRLNTESFVERLAERNKIHSPVYLIGEYVNMKTKIKIKCDCNHEWDAKPQDVLNGHGCVICAVNRRETTMIRKYGRSYYTKIQQPQDTIDKLTSGCWLQEQHHTQQKTLQQISIEVNVSPKCVGNYIHKHNIEHKKFGNSQGERHLIDFLKEYTHTPILVNDRTLITPKELDIYIPDYNLAIEFDGIHWHSELQGKHKTYHLSKTLNCQKQNVRLVHIFENEWLLKQDIVKSRIKSLLGVNTRIFARKCEIVTLTNKQFTPFFNTSHIQGTAAASICYGLVYNNEIVAAMSFGKSRFDKNIEYELIRYSNALDINVIGGASKLFTHFIKQHQPKTIISYSDVRWNTGNLYNQLGFVHSHNTNPNYFYFHPSNHLILYSRQTYQKHKLYKVLTNFTPSLTEWENMKNNGYDRIWDCGNSVWIFDSRKF